MTETPKQLGFIMPAEWEKHSSVWLAWPYDEVTFPGRVEKIEKIYVEIIKHLHLNEDVDLLVLNTETKTRIEALLKTEAIDLSKITFHITEYADVWMRDFGPTFVINRELKDLAWIKWGYNAYGNKFPELVKDNETFFALRKDIDRRMFEPGLFMEGGAVEVNSLGTLITTEQCLLNPNRNPKLNKQDTEKYLREFLGVKKIIWLQTGLTNDHTDGHIDELARFVNDTTIVCAYEEDGTDENFKILDDNYRLLKNSTDAEGNPFRIIKLPMPHMKYEDGTKAPVSYANFYIANETVLAATFNDPNDQKALELLQAFFPDKKVVSIDCSDLIYGGGGIHCITQQQPKV